MTTDVNQAEGGRLVLQSNSGNVGIGTYTPNAGNKLEVNGKIAAQSLNTLDQSVKIEGSGGRNMFSDNEKAGDLRVGGAWGTPTRGPPSSCTDRRAKDAFYHIRPSYTS